MNVLRLSVLAAGLLGLMSCSSKAGSAPPASIVGELNSASVSAARAQLAAQPPPRTLRVRSAGGQPEAAISLADALREHQATLVVDGYCLGACAQYLFMSAPRREVTRGSLVGFNNSVVAGADLMRSRGRPVPPQLAHAEQVDRGAYRRWGVPLQALRDQFSGLSPACVQWGQGERSQVPRFQYAAQTWTPPREWVLANSPQPLTGWWPQSQAQAETAYVAVTRDLPHMERVRYGAPLDWGQLQARLASFPCRGAHDI